MPMENTSNAIENFNVTDMRQMTDTQKAPNRQTHVEPLPLFTVALTRNKISSDIQAE